jgi:hypothetical protein
VAGCYFEDNWYSWTSNECFPLMTAASAHSHRDTKLPAGNHHRLRFVEPLADADRAALQALPRSPIYIKDAGTRDFVVSAAGNLLRNLAEAASQLPGGRNATKADRLKLWTTLWKSMENDSAKWLAELPEQDRSTAGETVMEVISRQCRLGGCRQPPIRRGHRVSHC